MSNPNASKERTLRARRLTAVALALCFMPPLWVATTVAAAPGNGWATPMDFKNVAGGYSYCNDVAADRQGNAMAVYDELNGVNTVIFARRFIAGSGWQPEVQISNNTFALECSVAVNAHGDAVAAWAEYNGSAYIPAVARYSADWGWSAPQWVQNTTGNNQFTKVAIDGAGTGFLLSYGWNGTTYLLFGTRIDANGSIDRAIRLDSGTTIYSNPQLAASNYPGVVAAWGQYNGSVWDIYATRYLNGAWQTPAPMENKAGSAYDVHVGVDDSGIALAIFAQYVPYWYVWYSTNYPGGAWSVEQYARNSGSNLNLAVAPSGAALMTFIVWNGTTYVTAAQRYSPGKGFEAPVYNTEPVAYYWRPEVAVDNGGNGLVLYQQKVGNNYTLRSAQFTPSGWINQAWVQEDGSVNNATQFKAAILKDGRALVVWEEYNGVKVRSRTNIFSMPDVSPPWVQIRAPLNGAVTSTPFIYVWGYAEPGSTVSVNGVAAQVWPSGVFTATVPLSEGYTWLYAYAVDAAGNTGYSDYAFVTYTNPQHLLDAEIARAGVTGWQDSVGIESINYWNSWSPIIQADSAGNAFALWYEYVYNTDHAYVSRYVPGVGWGTPLELQADDGYLWGPARMVVDSGGNATIVWCTYDFAGGWAHTYVTTYYAPWNWWYNQGRFDYAERYSFWPDVALAPDNRVLILSQERNETTFNYTAVGRFLTLPYSYSAAVNIENFTGEVETPRGGFDRAGNAYVAMRFYNGTGWNVAMSKWNGSAWDNGSVVQAVPTLSWNTPIAVDAGGNATVSWETNNGTIGLWAGRLWSNGTWSGQSLVWNNSWSWDPEVLADASGRAFVAFTATTTSAGAYAAVANASSNSWSSSLLDNISTDDAGGPKLQTGLNGTPVRASFDEYNGTRWHPSMREYNASNGSWGPVIRLAPDDEGGHIPSVAPMPDGGYIVLWSEDNYTLGFRQTVARRFVPYDVTPPTLNITAPVNGTTLNVSFVQVTGVAEVGARVWVNGIEVAPAANGSFAAQVPLANGTNVIPVRAQDRAGNTANRSVTVIFDSPDRRRIDQLEAANAALQDALNQTNASLWQALADQNASLLGVIAGQNASLLAKLAAQNSSLLAAIGNLNASVLASLAAQNSSLRDLIAATNATLLAELAATNADLTGQIADLNLSLLADLAAQNSALLQLIASTNASLFNALVAQNASLTDALAAQDSALLASLAAQNDSLRNLIASTNTSLLASLAAQNATLRALLAAQDSALLASLAAQNATLRDEIARTNTTLLAELEAQNATLRAQIYALDATSQNSDASQNTTLTGTQGDLNAVRAQAQSAGTLAMAGVGIGLAGVAAAAAAILLSRRRPPAPPPEPAAAEPSKPATAEVVDVASGPSRGHSMGAEGELAGTAEIEA